MVSGAPSPRSSCYESAPGFCCPLCDSPNGAFLLNLASGTWALEVIYDLDNTTKSLGIAPYDTSSRTFFGLPYAVTLTCTAAGSCNRVSASSVVTGSINGLPGGDVRVPRPAPPSPAHRPRPAPPMLYMHEAWEALVAWVYSG